MPRGYPLFCIWLVLGQAAGADVETNIRMRTFDYTGLSPIALDRIGSAMARLVDPTGLTFEWIVCRPTASAIQSTCEREAGANDFVLRIVWETPGQPPGELGFTYANDRDASLTTVSRTVAEKIAAAGIATREQILAYGAIHELGHAILGAHCHGRRGVMQAVVHRRDLAGIAADRLTFTHAEARQLRARMRERIAFGPNTITSGVKPGN